MLFLYNMFITLIHLADLIITYMIIHSAMIMATCFMTYINSFQKQVLNLEAEIYQGS